MIVSVCTPTNECKCKYVYERGPLPPSRVVSMRVCLLCMVMPILIVSCVYGSCWGEQCPSVYRSWRAHLAGSSSESIHPFDMLFPPRACCALQRHSALSNCMCLNCRVWRSGARQAQGLYPRNILLNSHYARVNTDCSSASPDFPTMACKDCSSLQAMGGEFSQSEQAIGGKSEKWQNGDREKRDP